MINNAIKKYFKMEEYYFCENCQRDISSANFATHSAFCERNIKVCSLCSEPISISEEKKHLEECHITVQCDYCKNLFEKWMLPDHQVSCTKRPVTCEFCDSELADDEYLDHFEFCSSRTEKCLFCQKYVMLKDKTRHSEIHLCERNIRGSIESEVKQNLINEVISDSYPSEETISKKVFTAKHSSSERVLGKIDPQLKNPVSIKTSKHVIDRSTEAEEVKSCVNFNRIINKDVTHLESRLPMEAGACAIDKPIQKSKFCTTCHICKQSIPWIDFNTHVPSCAADAGKCSRCGEDVPKHAVKDHMLKTCKLLLTKGHVNESYSKRDIVNRNGHNVVGQKHVDFDDMFPCRFCKQLCSADRIDEHMRDCPENSYQCPFCTEKILARDKKKHENFECKVLIEINHPGTTAFESYAETAKKSVHKKKKDSSNCETCCPCHSKDSQHRMQEHSYSSQRNQKRKCLYCFEEICVSAEDTHLGKCKKFNAIKNSESEPVSKNIYKGAIPKNASFADMAKPRTAKCKFCKTTLNEDIIFYHEKECVHEPRNCDWCGNSVLRKDFDTHTCKSKKEKGKQGKHGKHEEKTGGSFGFMSSLRNKFYSDSNGGSKRCYSEYPSDTSNYDTYYKNESSFSHNEMEEKNIPCEFCGILCSASDIVLHETGCNPELACFTKKDSNINEEIKPTIPSKQTNMHPCNSDSAEIFFNVERQNILQSSRPESLRKHTESNFKPGEFLKSEYSTKTLEPSSSVSETAKEFKQVTLHSVWNFKSSTAQKEENNLKNYSQSSFSEQMPDEKNYCKVEELGEIQKSVTGEHSVNSDEELAEMLDFINEDESKQLFLQNYKENTSNLTSGHAYSQLHHKDFIEQSKIAKTLSREDVKTLSEDRSKQHLPNFAHEYNSYLKKTSFLFETAAEHYRKDIRKDEGKNEHYTEGSDTFLESHSEVPDDVAKWAKWQNRSSDST